MMMRRRLMAGLSLIELLVAMTIALVAVLAATALYNSTRQTYRVQAMQNRLAEDGRFAISMLQRVVTQAGFRPTPATPWVGFATPVDPAVPTTTNPPAVTPTSTTEMTVRFIADGSGAATPDSNQIDCDGQSVTTNSSTELVISQSTAGSELLCGLPAQAEAARTKWIASSGAGTELVNFRLGYGIDVNPDTALDFGCGASGTVAGTLAGDCVADDYLPTDVAPTVMPTTAQPIVAVRACLVLRSDTTDTSITREAAWKNCWDNDIAASLTDHKLYRTFRTTILLRNR
ncbi:PilW family protein [Azonexus sp.]|jgi:type II secretory pathway pseudopilin PulG|uniref:PilW family protein n=1 Tax=Azonexus sp. TaxID=1872668 RepID=UPI0028388D9E|nr:PilW family protein [Azonexus sp.]MDR1994450.1 PilW family protein [Azonexus sp.]